MPSPDLSRSDVDAPHTPNGDDAQRLIAEALDHLNQGDLEAAAQLFEQVPYEALDAASALTARALALQVAVNEARYNDAMEHAAAALDISEEEPFIYHLLGQVFWATGDIRTGAEALVRAAELFQTLEAASAPVQLPVDPLSVYFMAGEACQYYEQYQAALAFFQQAQRHTPRDETVTHAIANVKATLDASGQAA